MRASGVVVLLATLVLAGCGAGTDDGAGGDCVEIREPEDPLSIQHVIDPGGLVFLTDPPTSGPHIAGPPAQGLFTEPLAPAAQVRALEAGGVVVQYSAPVTDVDVRTLLDANEVPIAIAPAEALSSPVIATAWTWKLSCAAADLDAIARFAATRTADAPGED